MYVLLNSVVPLLLGPQDLKKKYAAQWALVTGASSGIGKELARKLLHQGLDVILVARDEPLFYQTVGELQTLFPQRQVVQVGANLSDESGIWMKDVHAAVGDKRVQVVFLNAGYILTGMYEANAASAHLPDTPAPLISTTALRECRAHPPPFSLHFALTATVHLSLYVTDSTSGYEEAQQKLKSPIERGVLCRFQRTFSYVTAVALFVLAPSDSSCQTLTAGALAASYIPNPFAVMYGATKAAVSALAASLAVEGRARGIHVHAIHPSPVNSRFSSGGGNQVKVTKIEAMDQFYKFATGPEVRQGRSHASSCAAHGKRVRRSRMVVHVLGYNLMAFATAVCAPLMPDYKKGIAQAAKKS
ncbi:MAG: hypothetical protein SGPRY_012759 [Prymnesium sp.]